MRERACNNCGGKNYEIVGQNLVKCLFCGTLYVDEQASKDEEFLLARANDLLRELQFDVALDQFNKIISLFPLSFEAFFGRALAKHKIVLFPGKRGILNRLCFYGEQISLLSEDEDFQKALSLAPQERAKTFTEIAKKAEQIKKNYDLTTSKNVYDCILCVCGKNGEKKLQFREKILEILNKNELSFFDFEEFAEKEKEEFSFRALETARVFVLVALDESEISRCRNLFDRYFHLITLRKKTKSSFVLCLDAKNIKLDTLPKEFESAKDVLDTFSISFMEDLETRIVKEYQNSRKELARIDTIALGKENPKKKEYVGIESVEPVELGHFDVENIAGSSQTKKKWIFLALKNGDFETARKLTEEELENDPCSSELLLAQLFAERKIHSQEEFFSKISNFNDTESLERILQYADKEFAENFVDEWEKLVQNLDEVEFFNKYLTKLASFKTPNREKFVKSAENKAIETLDEELISNVEKCFAANEVDRFVEFYFALAQKSDDKKYFNKILELDEGHEESNLALMLQKFKTVQDKLSYRDRNEIENMLKFLAEPARVAFVSAVIEMILPIAFFDLQEAQKQIEFYLSYIQDENALVSLLKKISASFQEQAFFTVAEKYLSIAISKESDNNKKSELFWKLIQIKCHCRSDEELVMTKVKPTELPEWETLLALGDENHDEHYASIVSKNNLYDGEKLDFAVEFLDKVQLKEKLNNFLLRNNQILLDIEKQEGASAKKGIRYFQLQLLPFEKYIEKIDEIEEFEKYQNFVDKIYDRLFALNLTLDSSISVLKVKERSEDLAEVEFDSALPSQKLQKAVKKHKTRAFLSKLMIVFLEIVPLVLLFSFLIFSLFKPKETYFCFSQNCIIWFTIFSVCVAIGNVVYFFIKKRNLPKSWGAALISFAGLGILNLLIFLLSFYVVPMNISISNENELRILLANAQYCDFSLEKDVEISSGNWASRNFYGVFDGKGHKISNLSSAFLNTNSGEVKNLIIEIDIDIKTENAFGALANKNEGIIRNCVVSGQMTVKGAENVGSLVGINTGKLLSCEIGTTMIVENEKNLSVGGIVGGNENSFSGNEISKCTFEGEIEGFCEEELFVGGLIGQENGDAQIFQCFSKVSIVSSKAKQATIGGLIGYGKSASHDNYAVGSISTDGIQQAHIGGLYGSAYTRIEELIQHSYSNFQFQTNLKVGLLVGMLSGRFDHCFAVGEGALYAQQSGYGGVPNCVAIQKYEEELNFDPSIWNLSENLPTFLWELNRD